MKVGKRNDSFDEKDDMIYEIHSRLMNNLALLTSRATVCKTKKPYINYKWPEEIPTICTSVTYLKALYFFLILFN